MEKSGCNSFNKFREKLKKQKEVIDNLKDWTNEASVRNVLAEKGKLNELLLQEEIILETKS